MNNYQILYDNYDYKYHIKLLKESYSEYEIVVKNSNTDFFDINSIDKYLQYNSKAKVLLFICDRISLKESCEQFNKIIEKKFPNLEFFVFKHNYVYYSYDFLKCDYQESWNFNGFPKSIKKFYLLSDQTWIEKLNFKNTNLQECILCLHMDQKDVEIEFNTKLKLFVFNITNIISTSTFNPKKIFYNDYNNDIKFLGTEIKI